MNRRTACLTVLLLAAAAPLAAQQRALTPEDAVRLGLANNPRVAAAAADARAAAADLGLARAARRPSLRATGGYTRLSSNIPDVTFTVPGTDSTVTFQTVPLDRWQAELGVEQSLLSRPRRYEVRAAEADARAADALARRDAGDLAFEIRRAYWELVRAEAVLAALDGARERVAMHLADVEERQQAGAVLTRDLLAAQTRRSEVELERVGADNAVRVSRLELARLLGLPLDTALAVSGDIAVDSAAPPLADLTEGALASRPDLAAAGESIAALRARVSAADAARLPELDLVGRYLYARPNAYFFTEQDRFRHTWELGLSLRWDLWSGGGTRARAGALAARLQAAQARLADARAMVTVDVARRRLEVLRAAQAVGVATQQVREAEETFRVARRQFQEGVALAADVLDAESALRRAQSGRAEARADYAIARAALLHGLGRTW